MNQVTRCAVYARFSTEMQNSTADQVRKCAEHAEARGWRVVPEHVYADEAVSGAGADRGGLGALLAAALSGGVRPFDVVLVDDTSRLSRNLADAMRLVEQLRFAGVRLVAVSQGIDTADEQSDVLVTVHGLVDSLYVRELAGKVRRGLEGCVLRGLHAGGRCFGYRNVAAEGGGVRLEVDPAEAAVVRRIFESYANGESLKAITVALNREGVAPPRPRKGKRGPASWCKTAIREMLRRELYAGRVVWNQSRWVKVPGTNRRLRRARPQAEWRVAERPELRIVPAELWACVEQRLQELAGRFPGLPAAEAGRRSGRASSPHLLSGILKCGVCGGNLSIIVGRGRRRYARYGCPQYATRGACVNNLTERQEWIEARLLSQLQDAVLTPAAVEYALESFAQQLRVSLAAMSDGLEDARRTQAQLERKRANLVRALGDGYSPGLTAELASVEGRLAELSERLLASGPGSVEAEVNGIREFVSVGLADLRELLREDSIRARETLRQYIPAVRMVPTQAANGERFYRAEGEFDLLGARAAVRVLTWPSAPANQLARLDGCGGWI